MGCTLKDIAVYRGRSLIGSYTLIRNRGGKQKWINYKPQPVLVTACYGGRKGRKLLKQGRENKAASGIYKIIIWSWENRSSANRECPQELTKGYEMGGGGEQGEEKKKVCPAGEGKEGGDKTRGDDKGS